MARIYRGIAGGVDINTETIANGINYGVGFGGGDLRRALDDGYSAQSILDYLNRWGKPVNSSSRASLESIASSDRARETQQQQSNLQRQIEQQQAQFQAQLAAQQEKSKEAQRQLMIQMQRPDRAPAEVRMARGDEKQEQLRRRGTTGYFGREGLRIGSLNVPTPGMSISSGAGMQPTSGSFV